MNGSKNQLGMRYKSVIVGVGVGFVVVVGLCSVFGDCHRTPLSEFEGRKVEGLSTVRAVPELECIHPIGKHLYPCL